MIKLRCSRPTTNGNEQKYPTCDHYQSLKKMVPDWCKHDAEMWKAAFRCRDGKTGLGLILDKRI